MAISVGVEEGGAVFQPGHSMPSRAATFSNVPSPRLR
jgi:hypothetical protein